MSTSFSSHLVARQENPSLIAKGKDWFRLLSDPDPTELERMMRVGQSVTWPKLHMIKNRAKIERQIYLGRHYVRKALRGLPLSTQPSQPLPSTSHTQASLSNPWISALAMDAPQANSDRPMSVDTDKEIAFDRKSHWFFRKGQIEPPTPTSGSVSHSERFPQGGLRPAALRRKRTLELVNSPHNGASNAPHPAAPSHPPSHSKQPLASGGLLSRLRARSFPNLSPPFSMDLRAGDGNSSDVGEHWSSDSSSEDDLTIEDRRHLRCASAADLDPLDATSGDV
ncbi:hypothetical protein H0H87_008294 [Tephrocybe sp. NHM501043]|nr:hypothetical protein H0H87_008294 [Tephrocybe sp. NHM501043]